MAKCAICSAVLLSFALSSAAQAATGSWIDATVLLTASPVDSMPRAFRVTSAFALAAFDQFGNWEQDEYGNPKFVYYIKVSDGQGNSREFRQDDLGTNFVLLDGAATYFRAQLVADPMNAFALDSLALVERQFGQTDWANLDTQKVAEMRKELPGEPGQSRVDWTLWVHHRVIPPEIYAVPAPEYVNLPQQFPSGRPCSPWTSNSTTLTSPIGPGPSRAPIEPAPAPHAMP